MDKDKSLKSTITWITADYFIDVDIPVVSILQKYYDIDWYVIKSYRSNIEIPIGYNYNLEKVNYRAKDPRIILDYYSILKRILAKQFDILYIDYLGLPYFYPILLKLIKKYNIQIIHAAHNVIPYNGWPNRRLMTYYVNYIFKHIPNFHLFSQYLFQYFRSTYKDKNIFYAPLSLKDYGNIQTNNYQLHENKCNLLFFGNVKPNKRLELLIDAVKSLPEEIQKKAHLTIAGACDNQEYYHSLIDGCPVISYYFKRIDDIDIPELFLKHSFLVLPYENVAQSGPHMIAYNYGLPVIASNIEGFKESVVDNKIGFLFEVNNKNSLTDTLKKAILLSTEEYESMKHQLKHYVDEKYSSESIINKYITFINSL